MGVTSANKEFLVCLDWLPGVDAQRVPDVGNKLGHGRNVRPLCRTGDRILHLMHRLSPVRLMEEESASDISSRIRNNRVITGMR